MYLENVDQIQSRSFLMYILVIAELWRAKPAYGAPRVSKSTHPRKFGNHVTVHRPPARCPSVRTTGIPMFTLTLSSYFGSPGESWLHINVVITWQLSKQGIRWPVSPDRIVGSGVDPSGSSMFLKLSADNLLVFKWWQAHVYFFLETTKIFVPQARIELTTHRTLHV